VITGVGWYLGGTYAAALCFFVGATMILFGLIKKEGEKTSNLRKSLLAVAVFALLGLIVYAATNHGQKPADPYATKQDLEKWLIKDGIKFKELPETSDMYFVLHVDVREFDVEIVMGKGRDDNLDYQTVVSADAEDLAQISTLSPDEYTQLIQTLQTETAKMKDTAYHIIPGLPVTSGVPLGKFLHVILNQAHPVSSLDAKIFADILNDMDSDATICKLTIKSVLRGLKHGY
jgi:hypothetical protein